ncbi:MAG TPA: FtsQ-type POTRA domain-containing protein, partial [Thermoanaerobaculia bacterium]|nr:FtsQ-type POTRA domain-containing protein [Thermoanaerobaculia bacterium]
TVLAAATFALSGLVILRVHPRFAVNRVVLDGVPEARRAETEELTDGWIGRPLLFLDLDQPVKELSKRSWVASATARRIVPDTIAVRVVARPPVALVARADKDGELWTIDRGGRFIGPYTGRALSKGDDFVVLTGASDAAALARGARFLEILREEDPELLARVSGIVLVPEGFAVTDRIARACLLFGPDAAEPRRAAPLWRAFLALRPELDRHSLPATEADLRFAGRIVLKAPGDTGRGKT